jgi:hypothetical protein
MANLISFGGKFRPLITGAAGIACPKSSASVTARVAYLFAAAREEDA